MARGIITKRPGGSTPTGRIIVTENTDDRPSDLAVLGATLGQYIDYTEDCSSEVGDVVEFAIDGGQGSHINTISKSTIITGTYQPDITIRQGETVLLTAATLNGVLITVNGGCLTVINNTVIKGRIKSAVDGSCVVISDGTSINGNFEFTGASSFSMVNTTSQGSVESNGNNFALVTGCTIKGQLSVLNAKMCRCSGNTVSGGTNTPGCSA